jgi:hypothetical protein
MIYFKFCRRYTKGVISTTRNHLKSIGKLLSAHTVMNMSMLALFMGSQVVECCNGGCQQKVFAGENTLAYSGKNTLAYLGKNTLAYSGKTLAYLGKKHSSLFGENTLAYLGKHSSLFGEKHSSSFGETL